MYLITYSSADVVKFPSKESFARCKSSISSIVQNSVSHLLRPIIKQLKLKMGTRLITTIIIWRSNLYGTI